MKTGAFLKFILAIVVWLCASLSYAQDITGERIDRMDVTVMVLKDGSLRVREEIDYVKPEGVRKRGIFRELPRYVRDGAVKVEKPYTLSLATRNGERETVSTTVDGNIVQWRLGEGTVFLEEGVQRYVLEYASDDWVVRYDDLDEIRWNVMGEYWQFPVAKLTGRVIMPEGAILKQSAGYTGRFGSTESEVTLQANGNILEFEATRPMMPGEAVTIAVGVEKGVVDPLSTEEASARWWRANGAMIGIGLISPLILLYYLFNWVRVGRDPPKPPVFARYEAPKAYSASAAHRILKETVIGDDALIATLLSLAIKGWIRIDVDKKETLLSSRQASGRKAALNPEESKLYGDLFKSERAEISLKKKTPSPTFHKANQSFRKHLNSTYSADYKKINFGYTFLGIALTGLGIFFILKSFSTPSSLVFWGLVAGLVICNLVFMRLMPAPTKKGAQVKSEIEGFKLYLETAEKLRLNAAKIGTSEVPPMSIERYEAYLPYAVALGVEKPWTTHFEKTLPVIAENYSPGYYRGSSRTFTKGGVRNMQRDMTRALSAGVASARPVQTSSSSGGSSFSSGGGSSGGGGGGGGGGSW